MAIHHIIPKHEWKKRFGNLDGVNAPDNLVDLTHPQHIQAHELLHELNGIEFDRLAVLRMSGRIDQEEAQRRASSFANKNRIRGPHTEEWKLANSKLHKGKKRSAEFRKARSEQMKGKRYGLGSKRDEAYKLAQSIRQKGIPQRLIPCPNCPKIGGISTMKQRHFPRCGK